MRLAVISDVHGNAVALEAVLADLDRAPADRTICLGDAIQGGPQPAEVAQRLRERAIPVVMGNADWFVLTGEAANPPTGDEEQRFDAVRAWTLSKLGAAELEFIRSFPPTLEVPLESKRSLLAFHGSPASFDELIFPDTPEADLQRILAGRSQAVLTGGHTHVQFLRRLGDGFFFNPGSVGVAYNRHPLDGGAIRLDPWAEYAVLTSSGRDLSLEFRRVTFDVGALREAYARGERPFGDEYLRQYADA